MTFYRLEISGGDADADGEDFDEWFSSLREAKRRRAELIAADPHLQDSNRCADFAIKRVELTKKLTAKGLLLACLSRKGYAASIDEVVEAYRPKPLEF